MHQNVIVDNEKTLPAHFLTKSVITFMRSLRRIPFSTGLGNMSGNLSNQTLELYTPMLVDRLTDRDFMHKPSILFRQFNICVTSQAVKRYKYVKCEARTKM